LVIVDIVERARLGLIAACSNPTSASRFTAGAAGISGRSTIDQGGGKRRLMSAASSSGFVIMWMTATTVENPSGRG
jgi:hypothetical protein